MTTLVTGANGTISSHLLTLLAGSHDGPLRALVRPGRPAPEVRGVDVVQGDLDRPDSLTAAMSGVSTLWLLTAAGPLAPHQSSNAIWAARAAGVDHVVRLSAIGAAYDAPTRNGRLHALSDAELAASGIPWTIIRPSAFMQSLLPSVVDGTLYHNWGDGRVGFIDARDIAELAARVLSGPAEHANRTYTITGPRSVSIAEAASLMSGGLDRPITAREIPTDAVVGSMSGAGVSEWLAEVVGREYGAAYRSGWGDFVTQDFESVVGRPARGLVDFARDHASVFGRHPVAA